MSPFDPAGNAMTMMTTMIAARAKSSLNDALIIRGNHFGTSASTDHVWTAVPVTPSVSSVAACGQYTNALSKERL